MYAGPLPYFNREYYIRCEIECARPLPRERQCDTSFPGSFPSEGAFGVVGKVAVLAALKYLEVRTRETEPARESKGRAEYGE